MKKVLSIYLLFSIFFASYFYLILSPKQVKAAALTTGTVTLSDSRPSESSVTYTINFSGITLSAIKCIKVQFSDASTGGSKPTGMNITSLALSGTTDYIPTPASWTPSNNNSSGVSSITYGTGETPASASDGTVVLTTITNGSVNQTAYFLQFSTYNNVDCTSSPVDSAVIDFIYISGVALTASVDPTLTMLVAAVNSGQTVNSATTTVTSTSTTIPFGTVTSGANAIAAQDLTVGTNAVGGYTVTTKYTGALTNGSHSWVDLSGAPNSAPIAFTAAGTESLGYTTEDFSLQTGTAGRFNSNKWAAFTTSPLEVIYNNAAVSSQTTRVGFQIGTAISTPAGSYTTTIVYVLTATY